MIFFNVLGLMYNFVLFWILTQKSKSLLTRTLKHHIHV